MSYDAVSYRLWRNHVGVWLKWGRVQLTKSLVAQESVMNAIESSFEESIKNIYYGGLVLGFLPIAHFVPNMKFQLFIEMFKLDV